MCVKFPSESGLSNKYPESPKFVVFNMFYLSVSNFASTQVEDPMFLFTFTALTRICFNSLAGFFSNKKWISLTSCFENKPESIPWLAQPPTPSATTSSESVATQASSPPLSLFSICGMFVDACLKYRLLTPPSFSVLGIVYSALAAATWAIVPKASNVAYLFIIK